jgi:FMN phosphatase YigB (HAD superfamily)
MKLAKPQLIVFDLDNTLYEYESCNKAGESAFAAFAAETFGISRKIAKDYLKVARGNVKSRVTGASSHERILYYAEFLAICNGVSDPRFLLEAESRYWSNYFAQMRLAAFARELLVKARLNGITVALVTDLTSSIQYRKLVYLGIDSLFDVIVTSQETSGEKETYEPFELLSKRLKKIMNLDSVWFVGDSKFDFPELFEANSKTYFISPYAQRAPINRNAIKLQSYKKLLTLLD